jgi:hypothetical protein
VLNAVLLGSLGQVWQQYGLTQLSTMLQVSGLFDSTPADTNTGPGIDMFPYLTLRQPPQQQQLTPPQAQAVPC